MTCVCRMLIVIFTIVADVDLVKGAPLEVPVTEFAPPLPVSFSYVEQVSRNLYNLHSSPSHRSLAEG